jgi:hypothetical protein
MLHHVAPVRTDVSEELSAPILWVTGIGELGTLAITSNRRSVCRKTVHTTFGLMMLEDHEAQIAIGTPVEPSQQCYFPSTHLLHPVGRAASLSNNSVCFPVRWLWQC